MELTSIRLLFAVFIKTDGFLANSKYFSYFCTVISWMADNELSVLIRGLALFLENWRLPTFASDPLKIRSFQMQAQRKMAVDAYNSVYISARHKCALS